MITNNDPPNSPARTSSSPQQFRPPKTVYAYHDPEGTSKVTTTVVHALADIMDVDVSETEFSLYDSVDPDALNRLFAPKSDGTARPPGHVAFGVQGYRVTVYSSGEIAITPP